MQEYEYKILYGLPNQLISYGGRDKLEEDLNRYVQEGYEIQSTHFAAGGNPVAMIIMRKKLI